MSVTRARHASPLPASVAGRTRKTRLRREYVYAVVISLLLLAAIVSLAPYMGMGNISPPESKPEDLHQGKIILRGDDDQCMQAKFDNDSGKIGKGFDELVLIRR